jgi:predicted Zn finger-like uncharacterized protein
MIIQCRKCETRFRFDEAVIEGDGVWVRCSRCQHVFFQEQPSGETLAPAGNVTDPEIPSVRISDARRSPADSFSLPEERLTKMPDEGVEIEKEPTITGIDDSIESVTLHDTSSDGESEEATEEEEEEEEPEEGDRKRGWGKLVLKVAILLVCVVLIAGAVSVWLIPEVRTQLLELGSPWIRNVPGVEKFLATEKASREAAPEPVRLKDVRQRSVANLLVGNLRVVEGVAVNQSSSPLGKIRVRLIISDAYDVVLGEKIVYCGNIMTDEELNTLAEAEIQRELSTPQGTDVANERIAPNGEIPFMIVFSLEHAGAIKTVVSPAGADRVP